MKYKNQSGLSKFFEILVIVFVLGAMVAGIFAIGSLFHGYDAYSEVGGVFVLGTLGTTGGDFGRYITSDENLYTRDAIECTGLEIKKTGNMVCRYRIFYYNDDQTCVGYSEHSMEDVWIPAGQMPKNSSAFRVVIVPEDGAKDVFVGGNFIQGWLNQLRFANSFEIKITNAEADPADIAHGSVINLITPAAGE